MKPLRCMLGMHRYDWRRQGKVLIFTCRRCRKEVRKPIKGVNQ